MLVPCSLRRDDAPPPQAKIDHKQQTWLSWSSHINPEKYFVKRAQRALMCDAAIASPVSTTGIDITVSAAINTRGLIAS